MRHSRIAAATAWSLRVLAALAGISAARAEIQEATGIATAGANYHHTEFDQAHIAIPKSESGASVTLTNLKFIRVDQFNVAHPELSFKLVTVGDESWAPFMLRFDIAGFCNSTEFQKWADTLTITPEKKTYVHNFVELDRGYQMQGCHAELMKISRPDVDHAPLITEKEAWEQIAKQEQDNAEEVAAQREKQRQLDQENERLRKQREAKIAKEEAAQRAADAAARIKRAEENRRIAANCHTVYLATADKKIGDLTVREDELIKACRAVGMYR